MANGDKTESETTPSNLKLHIKNQVTLKNSDTESCYKARQGKQVTLLRSEIMSMLVQMLS